LIGESERLDDLAGGEPLGHELSHGLLGLGACLGDRSGDLAHLARELLEEGDLLAQVDHGLLGADQRVPLGERCLLVEELADARSCRPRRSCAMQAAPRQTEPYWNPGPRFPTLRPRKTPPERGFFA
jgi:hypothetical protein